MIPAVDILDDVALAPKTTLELGGRARHYVRAKDEDTVRQALAWAQLRGVDARILGGGSNLVIGDEGFSGLVIEMALEGIDERSVRDRVEVTAAAGEDWDGFVERCVASGYQGLECLSGIPGRVGATPIQNVGAYGQEVSETICAVRVLNRETRETEILSPEACRFAYRHSAFKEQPARYVVLAVTFALVPDAPPAVRYAELERALGDHEAPWTLSTVRDLVIALRRKKSMVLDPDDENRRSAGSFFTNPIVTEDEARRVFEASVASGIVSAGDEVPRWPAEPGPDGEPRVKLAAGWLVERAGMTKELRHGAVGISSRHALSLVHHGGGTTHELLELAERVRAAVRERFAVELSMEPTVWAD